MGDIFEISEIAFGMKRMFQGNGEHILLVDDVSLVETEKQLIEQSGYRATACSCSAEALTLLHAASEKIDCVISNLVMPRIGGLQLANTCRLCRPGTPFFLMGDDASKASVDSSLRHTISDFILKPLSARVLAETLHRALTRRKA
jgi:DNA-binding NtrC family response regulator